jgi:uncharacterized Zn-binding protein involved in type VI secretion
MGFERGGIAMGRPAARITDPVIHPLPGILVGGPTAITVIIGGLPAWRGVGAAGAAALNAAKAVSDAALQTAEAATLAAAGTPGAPAAIAAEKAAQATAVASMGSMMSGMGTDIHVCATIPPIPHGSGIVIDPSTTVIVAGQPQARLGDTIMEPLGPPNKIVMGCPTVLVGG